MRGSSGKELPKCLILASLGYEPKRLTMMQRRRRSGGSEEEEGPRAADLLAQGLTAEQAMERLLSWERARGSSKRARSSPAEGTARLNRLRDDPSGRQEPQSQPRGPTALPQVPLPAEGRLPQGVHGVPSLPQAEGRRFDPGARDGLGGRGPPQAGQDLPLSLGHLSGLFQEHAGAAVEGHREVVQCPLGSRAGEREQVYHPGAVVDPPFPTSIQMPMTPNAQRGDHDADSRRISGQQMSSSFQQMSSSSQDELIPCRLDPYGRSPGQDLGQVNPFWSPGTQRRAQTMDQDAPDVVGRQGWVRDRVDEIEGLRRRVLQEAGVKWRYKA